MIDQHLFLLDVFLLCLLAVAIAIPLSRYLPKEKSTEGNSFENISTEGFGKEEAWGISLVVLLFSASIWLPLLPQMESSESANKEIPDFLYAAMMLIAIQFFVPTAILLFMLGLKTNILDALGLRNCNWGKISFFVIAGITATYFIAALLDSLALEAWLSKHFEVIDEQAAVKALKEANAPLKATLMIFTAVIVAPICEEILFRCFLYTLIKKYTGVIFGVLSSALIFSVIHGSVTALIPLFLIGIILAVIYELSGSVWTNILMHAMFNLINVIFILSM